MGPPPVVVDWKFANDNLCSNIPINTPPTITLIGANPLNLTLTPHLLIQEPQLLIWKTEI